MLNPNLNTYFLKVSAYVLLKLAAKDSFRGKKSENVAILGYFSQAKMKECDQKLEVNARSPVCDDDK